MPVKWGWDQGHTAYFEFAAIQSAAAVLVGLNGVQVNAQPDPLLVPLQQGTGKPFAAPNSGYNAWRNYARVFKHQLLATDRDGVLEVTDAAWLIDRSNSSRWTLDEYFAFLIPRLYMVSPALSGYQATAQIVYPACALIRFLLAHGEADLDADVFGKIVGNDCDGTEPVTLYKALADSGYRPGEVERRQVREMITFLAQSPYLDFDLQTLSTVMGPAPQAVSSYLWQLAQPLSGIRLADRNDEIIRLGKVANPSQLAGAPPVPPPTSGNESTDDQEFTEGKKVRVEHLKTERSLKLKKAWERANGHPSACDICGLTPLSHYPWLTRASLHLHHVLPLSSSVHTALTSISDIIAICGPCHIAVHTFYKQWLDNMGKDDFRDKDEAQMVYALAKSKYVH